MGLDQVQMNTSDTEVTRAIVYVPLSLRLEQQMRGKLLQSTARILILTKRRWLIRFAESMHL